MAGQRTLTTLNRSAGQLKANFGSIEDRLGAAILLYAQGPSDGRREAMQYDLQKFREQHDKIIGVYEEMVDVDEDNVRNAAYGATLKDYAKRFGGVTAEVQAAFHDADQAANANAQRAQRAPIAAAAAQGAARPHKVDSSLKPKNLNSDFSVAELRYWEQQLRNWYETQGLANLPLQQQRAYFFSCLDQKIATSYNTIFPVGTPVIDGGPGAPTLIRMVREDFLRRIPLFQRRWELLGIGQEGQPWDEYTARVRRDAEDAAIDGMRLDNWLAFLCIKGADHKELKEKLMCIPEAGVDDLAETARAFETARLNLAVNTDKVHALRQQKGRTARPTSNSNAGPSRPQASGAPDCSGCGRKGPSSDHKASCPARNVDCNNCKKKGHFSRVCKGGKQAAGKARPQGRARANAVEEQQEEHDQEEPPPPPQREQEDLMSFYTYSIEGVNATSKVGAPTPRMTLNLKPIGKKMFKQVALPDSGATRSIINLNIA